MSYEDNLEYAKGGRISPEISATKPLKGTLGLGVNGNIWVNEPDKNGRLSWKPTLLTDTFKRAYPFIEFLEYPIKNTVYFKIVDKNFIFKFEYGYDEDSNYTLGYANSDVVIVKSNKFNFLVKSFFEDLSQEEYNRLNPDAEYTYNEIKEGVNNLFVILKNMIDEKVLRSSKNDEAPETPQPKFKIGDKVKIPKALISDVTVVNSNFDNNKKQWFYEVKNLKRGVTHFGIAEDELDFDIKETPEPKFKIGDKVKRINGNQVMTVVKQIYDTTEKEWDYDLVFEDGSANSLFESELEFDIEENPDKPEPKFKVGDKVIIKNSGGELATVRKIFNDNEEKAFYYDLILEDGQDVAFFEKQLELYVPEKTPFQQIDFTKPSTEELETVIKTIQMNSDKVTFVNVAVADIQINLKDRVLYVYVLFDKVNNIIKLYASGKEEGINCFSNEIQPKITNESLQEISEIYYKTLVKLIEKVEKYKDTEDCEADASLIVSEQVKKFYDLNKTRIEKLNANISCKIIKALVSLSDYEKCGLPSKSKIQLPKDNLLSEIQNLKF